MRTPDQMNSITIHFGSMAKPFEEQLNEQGYTLGDQVERLDEVYRSILRVYFSDLLTPTDFDKVLKKFNKKIVEAAIRK